MPSIIFDFYETLYDSSNGNLFPDAKNVLQHFTDKGYFLFLLGKGTYEHRKMMLEDFGIFHLFKDIRIVTHKTVEDIDYFTETYPDNSWFVVGDRIEGEIALANKCGLKSIWIDHGTDSAKHIIPWRTIHSLKELYSIIQ